MINKNIDVKDLINSDLFFPRIWSQHTCFSNIQEKITKPYYYDLDDMEQEDIDSIKDFDNWYSKKKKRPKKSKKN